MILNFDWLIVETFKSILQRGWFPRIKFRILPAARRARHLVNNSEDGIIAEDVMEAFVMMEHERPCP